MNIESGKGIEGSKQPEIAPTSGDITFLREGVSAEVAETIGGHADAGELFEDLIGFESQFDLAA